jgi:hypothetical protein
MARARRARSPWWVLVLTFFIGGLLGSVVAEALSAYPAVAFLARDLRIAIIDPPFTFDARVLTVTFGITLRLNLAIVIGWFLALWLFRLMV